MPKRRVAWVASVALSIGAILALAAVLSQRARAVGEPLREAPLEVDEEEEMPLIEGLEELHPALVHRLLNPDHEQDMAELRRIGMDHPEVMKAMAKQSQVTSSLMDLRQLLAYRRKMMANTSDISSTVSLESAAPLVSTPPHAKWTGSEIKDAKCGFHVGQTVLYLTEAGLAIGDAAQDCPQIWKSGKAIQGRRKGKNAINVCAIDIMAIFAGFGWTSFFISDMASMCTTWGKPMPGSECAADITAIIAALLDLGEAAAGVPADCKLVNLKQAAHKMHTHWSRKHGVKPKSEVGWCVIDPIQASYWLFRAALFIKNSEKHCPKGEWADCSIDALYAVSSFGWAAGFLAMAASDCAPAMNSKAQCAGDITDLVAAVTMVSAQSIAFEEGGCTPPGQKDPGHIGGGVGR